MKRLFATIACISMLVLAGCGASGGEGTITPSSYTPSSTETITVGPATIECPSTWHSQDYTDLFDEDSIIVLKAPFDGEVMVINDFTPFELTVVQSDPEKAFSSYIRSLELEGDDIVAYHWDANGSNATLEVEFKDRDSYGNRRWAFRRWMCSGDSKIMATAWADANSTFEDLDEAQWVVETLKFS